MDDKSEAVKVAVNAKKEKPTATSHKQSTARTGSKASKASAKKTAWTFPKNTLEDAIRIPKAIED